MKFCVITWTRVSLAGILLGLSVSASAQVSSLSIYSRFGLGQLQPQGNTISRGMGGVTASLADPFSVNANNPASYAFLSRTTYNLDVQSAFIQVANQNEQVDLMGGGLNSINLGLKRQGAKWGLALGIRPFSTQGYELTSTIEEDLLGEVTYSYEGEGGISQAHVGVARRFMFNACKGLLDKRGADPDTLAPRHVVSIGANLDYYFGQLQTVRRVRYAQSNTYDTRITRETDFGTINATFGALAVLNLSNTYAEGKSIRRTDLILAATLSPARDYQVGFEEINESIFTTSLGSEFVTDTAAWTPSSNGKLNIPDRLTLGAGVTHMDTKGREWQLLADIKLQDWTQFSSEFNVLQEEQLQAFQETSIGFSLTPRNVLVKDGALLRATYYLGARSTQSYLAIQDYSLSEQAVSTGISIPISQRRSLSKFHLGIELGSRGTTDNNLIQEQFINVLAGFSFSPIHENRWFVERKYD